MTVIHKGDTLILICGGVGKGEFGTAYGVGLNADSEYLRLYAGLNEVKIEGLGKDGVDRLLIADTGAHSVGGNILKAVARPYIHNTGLTQLLGEIFGDSDAGSSVLYPEFSRFLVCRGKGKGVTLGMGKEGGVKVCSEASLLTEIDPLFKVLGLDLVAVYPAAVFLVENCVAGVKIYLLGAGTKGKSHVKVGHKLLGGACAAGVVARGLNTARKRVDLLVEASYVVALPAVKGDGNGL